MSIWRLRIAYRIPKATNTHSEYVNTYCFFSTATVVTGTHLSVTLYVHCLSRSDLLEQCIPFWSIHR